jgi:hypothetical protein
LPWAIATIGMFWSVTTLNVIMTLSVRQRTSAWKLAVQSGTREAIDKAVLADDRLRDLALLSWGAVLIAALTVAAWTFVIARNASDRGVPAVRPLRTAGRWLIPLFGPPRAIKEISRWVTAFDYSAHRLTLWLYVMYVNFGLFLIMDFTVGSGFASQYDEASTVDALNRERLISHVGSAIFVITAALATRAVLHADRAVSGTRRPARSADVVSTATGLR